MTRTTPVPPASATQVPISTLITATLYERWRLGIYMSRLIIRFTRPNAVAREALRVASTRSASDLIAIPPSVRLQFATLATASGRSRR